MSQTGADALAKQGKNYEDIIKHYHMEKNLNMIHQYIIFQKKMKIF